MRAAKAAVAELSRELERLQAALHAVEVEVEELDQCTPDCDPSVDADTAMTPDAATAAADSVRAAAVADAEEAESAVKAASTEEADADMVAEGEEGMVANGQQAMAAPDAEMMETDDDATVVAGIQKTASEGGAASSDTDMDAALERNGRPVKKSAANARDQGPPENTAEKQRSRTNRANEPSDAPGRRCAEVEAQPSSTGEGRGERWIAAEEAAVAAAGSRLQTILGTIDQSVLQRDREARQRMAQVGAQLHRQQEAAEGLELERCVQQLIGYAFSQLYYYKT